VSLRVLVSGMLCGNARQAGATWAVAQYVLGLRALGHDVWVVEPVETEPDPSYVDEVVAYFELADRVAFVHADTGETLWGVDRSRLARHGFDVHVDIAGMLRDPLTDEVPIRVYLDLDPGFTQVWHAVDGIDLRLAGHTHFVTVGQSLGADGSEIPTCGVDWITTLPPVVLDRWRPVAGSGDAYTTVGNWRSYGSTEHRGVRYGQRAHSMRELLALPRHLRRPCEVALAIDLGETLDLEALTAYGWTLVDPLAAAGTPERYRAFIRGSWAELAVAKSGYVGSRSGWFSDRSACYLAAGRPVVAQDTGARQIPAGAGLLFYSDVDEAVAATEELERDYAGHARSARELASEYLDARRVLTRLLEAVGAG
jgi:hypothetical protein